MIFRRQMSAPPPTYGGDDSGFGRAGFLLGRLALRPVSFRQGWNIFVESRLGVISLLIIGLFALMAFSHPILMATVWDQATYDPVTGYAFDQVEQPAPPSWRHPAGDGSPGP